MANCQRKISRKVNIATDVKRHLVAIIASDFFKQGYVEIEYHVIDWRFEAFL